MTTKQSCMDSKQCLATHIGGTTAMTTQTIMCELEADGYDAHYRLELKSEAA